MITWHHIPARPGMGLPDQWQARAGSPERSVAVLRRCVRPLDTLGNLFAARPTEWQGVLNGPPPEDKLASLHVSGEVDEDQAKRHVEDALRDMGWR